MKSGVLLLCAAACLTAQPFSFGVRGGLPLADFVSASSTPQFTFDSSTNRYIVGPMLELRLPFGFGVEFDALYRRLHYNGTVLGVDTFSTSKTTGNRWEFPLLLKYRFPTRVVRPYVDAGVAWDTLTGLRQTVTTIVAPFPTSFTSTSSNPPELNRNTTVGFVIGGGVDIHILLHISPEIRYTRWTSQELNSAQPGGRLGAPLGLLQSNQNQAEFLLGVTF